MKKQLLILNVLICVYFLNASISYSQNIEFPELDSLKFYKSRVDEYKLEDISLHRLYANKIMDIANASDNGQVLFYAYLTLAKIYRQEGKYELAIKNYFQAVKYADYAENKTKVAEIYDELIYIYKVTGEPERMNESLEISIALKEKAQDIKGIYKTKLKLTDYHRNTRNYNEAFKIAYDALNYFENIKDTSQIILCHLNIARTYRSLGNYNKALETIDICNQFFNEANFKKERSSMHNVKGITLLKTKDYQAALDNFLQSLEIENQFGDKFRILNRYNNTGVAYLFLKNFEPALEYFRICVNGYGNSGRLRDLANVYNSLGMCYEEMNNPDSSIHYYLKSIEICDQINYKDLHLKSALWVSRVYDRIGNTDSSHIFLKKYHEIFEEIDKSNVTWEIIAKEFESIRQKDKLLEEIKRKNVLFLNIIIASMLMLLMLISWIIILKLRSKIQKSLKARQELEKHEIELKNQINNQNKELISKILQLNDSDSGVKLAIQTLVKLKSEMGVNSKQKIQQAINDLEHSVNNDIWDEFEERFMKVHPKLYRNLSTNFPNLTTNDRRLCALIHLNFSSKEIARITKQSHNSILVAKSRLRNKLNKPESTSIADFLHELTHM